MPKNIVTHCIDVFRFNRKMCICYYARLYNIQGGNAIKVNEFVKCVFKNDNLNRYIHDIYIYIDACIDII